MNTRMLPTTRCAGSYGVKRENQIVQFASGKLRVKQSIECDTSKVYGSARSQGQTCRYGGSPACLG
jgi:hypothetical protein